VFCLNRLLVAESDCISQTNLPKTDGLLTIFKSKIRAEESPIVEGLS